MATSKSLKDCISTNSTHELPDSIVSAADKGRADLMNVALDQHLNSLRTIRKEIHQQHHSNIISKIEQFPAKQFTSHKNDPGNELNQFQPVGGLKILVQNLVQRAGSIYTAAAKFIALDKHERKAIDDFQDNFNVEVANAINHIYKQKEDSSTAFRYEDMIQYLNSDSALHPVVKEAVAATLYEWLGNDASFKATGQTEPSLRSLLKLEKDERVPEVAWELLKGVGTHRDALAANIGRIILNRLSITDTLDSDALAKGRLEMSLGLLAIAALQEMGMVDRQEVFVSALDLLANDIPRSESETFYTPLYDEEGNDLNSREDSPTMKFISLRPQTEQRVQEIEKLMDNAPDIFNKLFNNETDQRTHSFNEIILPDKMKLGRSKQTANKPQRDNLQKYTNTVWAPSTHSMGAFEAMLVLSENSEYEGIFNTIIGKETMEGKLNIREKSVEGTNRGIDRDIKAIRRFLAQSKEQNKTKFFIPNSFMNNMRMLMRGHINPQNSKIMRNLFSPEGWKVSFNPDTDQQLDRAFHEAIALALDKESSKEGGVDQQITALHTLLNESGEIQGAIYAFREYDRTGQMTPELMQLIATGIKATGTKLHGFKGLLEYARYLNHKDKPATSREEFTTDIYKEIDGVSNGPIIGTMMLISNMAEKQAMLATIAMGGISISRQEVNLDELTSRQNKYLNDAYQRMGHVWAIKIAELKKDLKGKGKKSAGLLAQANAIGEIIGSFQDENGIVNSTIRNLSKPRTMQTTYGAGLFRQSKLFTGTDLIEDGIYARMEELIQNIQLDTDHIDKLSDVMIKEKLQKLLDNVATLTNTKPYDHRNYIKVDGTFDIERMSKFKLKNTSIKQIENVVANTYGKAMGEAIDEVYKSLIETRKPFLQSIQHSVTLYNTVLQTKVDALIENKIQNKVAEEQKTKDYIVDRKYIIKQFPEINRITKRELNEILEEIEPLMPKIKTPLHTETNPSFLPLASVGKKKQYAQRATVKQSYQSKTLPVQVAYAQGIPFLDPPGAAPMVKAIQMIDAMIANHLMGLDIDILNNHDGFSHGINASDTVRIEANKRFYEIMRDYSLGQEIADMYTSNLEAATQMIQDTGISSDVLFNKMINENIINKGIAAQLLDITSEDIDQEINNNEEMSVQETLYKLLNGLNKDDLVEDVNRIIRRDVQSTGKEVTQNKNEVVGRITKVMQYPDGGEGYNVIPIKSDDYIFDDIHVDKVLDIDAASTIKASEDLGQLVAAGFGSSQNNQDVSTSENDYPDSSKVDHMNVTQVLETLDQQDQQAGFASIPLSPDHKTHLTRILNEVVAKVMHPVQLFIGQHKIDQETKGLYVIDGKKVFLQTQQHSTNPQPGMLGQGIRMSAAEVYAHELIHHITHVGLKANTHLRNQAKNLYDFTRDAFEEKYGANAFRVFLNDPYIDINDPANAFEVNAAKDRWDYVFNPDRNDDGSNNGIDEFLSFGLTNHNFIQELSTLTLPDRPVSKALFGIFEKNVQTSIVNLFNKIMDFIHQQFYKQEHSTRVDQELENLVRAISEVDSRHKSAVYASFVDASNAVAATGIKMDERVKSVASKAMNITQLGRVITKVKQLPELDNMISHQMRTALNWYGDTDSEHGLLRSIAIEMQGTTGRMQPLHTLLNRRNRLIDSAKMEAAENIRKVVNSYFKEELTPRQKTAYTKAGLKTDLSYLVDRYTPNTLIGLVANEQQREDRINSLAQQLSNNPDLKTYRHFFEKAADDLGYFMVNSATRDGMPVLWNAHNIAMMKGTRYADALERKLFDKAVSIIDELVTLSALRYVSKNDKQMLADMMQSDWEGFEKTMQHHNLLKEDALKESFHGQPAMMQKGYTKQIINDRIQYIQGTAADRLKFTQMGYVMEKRPLPRDPNDPVRDDIYMFKSNIGMINSHQSGITSLTSNTQRGADPYRVEQQIGNTVTTNAEAQKNTDHMIAIMHKKMNDMFKATPRQPFKHDQKNYMIPKFDNDGNISGVRYMMNEHTKDTVLQQFSEVDAVLAAMTSQIIDKKYTPIINAEVVIALKDLYDKEYNEFPGEYVDISPTSKDEHLREIYHRFPDKMKMQIESVWGRHGMMVNRDVITLAFGQDKYSITEMFNQNKKNRNFFNRIATEVMTFALGANNPFIDAPLNTTAQDDLLMKQSKQVGRAVVRAKRIEEFATQLTSIAKSNIVVRNFNVVHSNYMSNMALLVSKNIPIHEILKGSRKAINSALQYQQIKHDYNMAVAQKRVTERLSTLSQVERDKRIKILDRTITRLEDELAKNPSTAMIAAGLLPQIVDDIDTARVESPYKYGLDKFIDDSLEKLPSKMEKATRVLFMSQDTEGYRMMNNAVKMTDYVGRFILYHHYTQTKKMSHKDAISKAVDEFINFDIPTHKSIEYLNSVGVLWFSRYQLRVLKHIKNVIAEQPFTALSVYLLSAFTGIGDNIINSIPGFTKGTFQNFGTPWSTLQGTPGNILYVDLVNKMGSAVVR